MRTPSKPSTSESGTSSVTTDDLQRRCDRPRASSPDRGHGPRRGRRYELFPEATIEDRPADDETTGTGELVAQTHTLEHFSELLHRQAILDTARAAFLDGLDGDTVTIRLKKQAAFEGVVNFAVGSTDELGDIRMTVIVRDPDPETYIEYVAPPTEDGVPIEDER